MSAQDLAKGLVALDDDEVRQKVAAGELPAAGALDLTEEEQGLLRGAAEDYPEVAGFAFDAYFKIDGLTDSVSFAFGKTATPGGTHPEATVVSASWNQAFDYLKFKLGDA